MPRTFLGFGFGPIQSALFLFEAFRSGNFSRYVVAEVDAALVAAVRDNAGQYTINIAHPDRIEQVTVAGVELYNPNIEADRAKLVAAVAEADEQATALPSVKFFSAGGAAAVTAVLADGLKRRTKAGILYAAENHNHAAEVLHAELAPLVSADKLATLQILNTVIGKMSGVITDAPTLARLNLAPLTPTGPGATRAVLVEAFNKILVSQVTNGYARAIPAFAEKPDLLPFEEAKLYGHNAIHALIGYLAALKNLPTMADAARHPDIIATARAAFLQESGAALIKKYAHLNDPLFTPRGYLAYADDLLTRMVNPNLNDLVARVIRDPARKLAWDDRLFGTMRLALAQSITPVHMARGAAAGVVHLATSTNTPVPTSQEALASLLRPLWNNPDDPAADTLIALTWQALQDLPR